MVIDANLILGNAASSGAGGGLRIQGLNGTDVGTFPTNPTRWNSALVTNNIIANNVAGWDGAGVSLQDSLVVNFINNTVMSNDSTASSGVLFDAFFAPLAGSPGQTCNGSCDRAAPQPSGLSVAPHSSEMLAQIIGSTTCPTGHANCKVVSDPVLANDVFWQNRSFHIGVTAPGTGQLQSTVALLNSFTNTAVASQTTTGACVSGTNYWDIGVRGDTSPSGGNQLNGGSDVRLAPRSSVIAGYAGNGNTASNPNVAKQYCNGSRIPPELQGLGFYGYQVPPGTNESNVPVPVFNLTAGATVDEGNNWINITWGPLSLVDPSTNAVLGDYSLTASSTAAIDSADGSVSPAKDFFGRTRPQGSEPDMGAVEFPKAAASDMEITPQSLAFGDVGVNTDSPLQFVTVSSTGSSPLAGPSGSGGITVTLPAGFTRVTSGTGVSQSCSTSTPIAVGATCRIYVRFHPTTTGAAGGTMTVNTNDSSPDAVADSQVQLSGRGVRISATPASLSFTTLVGGNFGAAQNVTVRNVGATPLAGPITTSITDVTNGVIFQVQSSTCPTSGASSLAPNGTCTVAVRFRSPTPFNQGTGTLNISDTEPATVKVSLTGTRVF
jgi:hypothetical protein